MLEDNREIAEIKDLLFYNKWK